MKGKIRYTLFLILYIFIFVLTSNGEYQPDILARIKPTESDIPAGFMYGKVPPVYRNVFKENPGILDPGVLARVTKNLYPEGDSSTISRIHVSIIANEKTPFGDDIVCYLILYKNTKSAEREIEKLTEFVQYNNDRAILLTRENLAIFLQVDNINNFQHIQKIAGTIEQRLDGTEQKTQCAAATQ